MKRAVICVDAGYLFAQGSVALTGAKQRRALLVLDSAKVLAELSHVAESKSPGHSLLRVYWYDGALGLRPTLEQEQLAHLDNVKVRLGFINSVGQQKGVDSLIVTDLIELARLGAISDAVLLSGDEDVRVGVQIAQSYGVRIHLRHNPESWFAIKSAIARSRHYERMGCCNGGEVSLGPLCTGGRHICGARFDQQPAGWNESPVGHDRAFCSHTCVAIGKGCTGVCGQFDWRRREELDRLLEYSKRRSARV